ncbi:MAG: ABC transporter permease [Clostridia bacterium]|jgi:fluoroquinolone transport system permease protein|nr:ABC transporter permease [Clostridia bacterium]MDD4275672.1 hypothetical protein [Clostridia bacterium]
MRNLGKLISGEIERATKYKILTVGVGVSLLWCIIIAAIPLNDVKQIVPLIVFTDSAIMSAILISASLFFERNEGTLSTLAIAPCSVLEILLSKIIMSVVVALLSTAIIFVSVAIFHGTLINFMLVPYVILVATLNSIIGVLISLHSRDFNSMLVNFSIFVILLDLPAVLASVGLLPNWIELITIILPSQASQILITSTLVSTELYQVLISLGVVVLWSVLLLILAVYPKFKEYMVKG